jgi:hypothetical protein
MAQPQPGTSQTPRRVARRLRMAALKGAVGFSVLAALGGPWLTEAGATVPAFTPSESELPALPALPKTEPALVERADIDELDARIQSLYSDNAEDRKEAVREVLEVRPRLMAAILSRLEKLAARADRERMKRVMSQIRERSSRPSDTNEAVSHGSPDSRPDLLLQLVDKARPKDDGWRDLLELVALSRMLAQVGNLQAARGLIEIYVRFGEFMRVDVQNRLSELKDGAVAALIEARRHRAEKVARWAERQLDRLGKAAPSEAIRSDNYEVLADVLRAYGRTKDLDAARIIVSYASSERYQLREAARQAIVMLGEVGIWQLRDAYENVIGKRPRRDWSWDRTARELFFEFDRLHAAKLYELLEQGRQAASDGRFEDMAKAYDALLARSPQFDRAATLASGYYALAEKLAQSQPQVAQAALVRVERLATDPALGQRARSLRDTLVAEQQLRGGVVDTYLLRSALERDPANRRARELLASGDRAEVEAQTIRTRWLTSGAIALTAVVAILFVLLRRRGEPMTIERPSDPTDTKLDNPALATEVENPCMPLDLPEAQGEPEGAPKRRRDPFDDL